ncbi:hypothetical protein [Maricaulis sp.]|uniref:hypothetical protein n=1 Tax=Maricaulis sp. TaxID=1486257 RepID=UPI0026155713|nr:hypothetical protein [Maricaulis sp.]
MRTLALFLLLLALTAPARADMTEARRAYQDGRWQAAAAHAQTAGGADGYAFAAGALLAQLMTEPDHPDREALAGRAADLAEYALHLDETHIDARVRLAGALGYRGRQMSGWRAYLLRLPQRGHDLLEEAVTADPDDPWALGMLGAWHLEVARRGGRRGMTMLDASVAAGMGYYSQAIALDPGNPAPRFFYAVALAALDEPAHWPRIREQIETVLALPPRNALDSRLKAEAAEFAALLGDRRAAAAWAGERMAR